jgi:hypothetical protein
MSYLEIGSQGSEFVVEITGGSPVEHAKINVGRKVAPFFLMFFVSFELEFSVHVFSFLFLRVFLFSLFARLLDPTATSCGTSSTSPARRASSLSTVPLALSSILPVSFKIVSYDFIF